MGLSFGSQGEDEAGRGDQGVSQSEQQDADDSQDDFEDEVPPEEELNWEDLELPEGEKRIGHGAFGDVLRGQYKVRRTF